MPSGQLSLEIGPTSMAAIDIASVETEFRYEGYLRRQEARGRPAAAAGSRAIP